MNQETIQQAGTRLLAVYEAAKAEEIHNGWISDPMKKLELREATARAVHEAGVAIATKRGDSFDLWHIPTEAIEKAEKLGQAAARFERDLKLSLVPGFDQLYPTAWSIIDVAVLNLRSQTHLYQ